jgi:WD repeat and SOF domain-containing protein 1
MKIKTLSRSADNYLPVRETDSQKLPRNLDPALHPFERAREYTRALNATKLDKVFAQPFVGQLGDGHIDGVYSIAKNTRTLAYVATGSGDGVVKLWDLAQREEIFSVQGHNGIVRGLTVNSDGYLLSCASDRTVKMWDVSDYAKLKKGSKARTEPIKTFLGSSAFMGIDSHRDESKFVTAGNSIELWDTLRSKPVSNISWGSDNVTSVKFNQTETSILASAGTDRSVVLYDIRTTSPIQKLVATLKTNALAWNPMEAFYFAAGSEDHNTYIYDMRNLTRSVNVMKDHVAAVLDVDFDPTGQEIVTGSYDRSIRIFRVNEGHSREVYHTKRMQHVFATRFTTDSKFILSGSDDGNVRVWRTNASERVGVKSSRQKAKLEYDAALKERYKHMPEIRRIARHRHLPKVIKKAGEIKRTEIDSLKRKEENVRKHSKKGTVPYLSERKKHIIGVAIKDQEEKKDKK